MSAPTAARRAAYATLRRVFEEGAWADRALRAEAERLGLEGRERAQAQALAYGAVQRRGTSDHFAAVLAGARCGGSTRRSWRRSASASTSCSSRPRAPSTPRSTRRSPLAKGRGGRRRGAGLVNAVLRRAARERDELLGTLDDGDPDAAAVAHSVPPWLAGLWWRELGADSARSLLAAVNEPPELALRANGLRGDRAAALARLAAAGIEARAADPHCRRRRRGRSS